MGSLGRLLLPTLLVLSARPAPAQTVGELGRLQVLPGYEMRAPTAVWDGARYLVVFEAFPAGQPELADLYLARIDRDGGLETDDVRPLGLGGADVPQAPRVAVHGTSGRAMVAYLTKSGPFSDVAVAWFDALGMDASPPGGLTLSTGPDAELPPSVAGADDGFLVMWATLSVSGATTISGQRFMPDGQPVDPSPEALRAMSTTTENRPSVVGSGDRFWVGWDEADGDDLNGFVTTVRFGGPFRFQAPVRIAQGSDRQSGLTIAPLGEKHYAVWQDFRRDVPDAWGARLQDSLQIDQGPHIVTQVDGRTNEPEIAGDANGALVVWQSLRQGRTRGTIRAGRIDTAGRRLEPEGFEVLAPPDNVFESSLAKGPDDQYLVVAIEFGVVSRLVFALVGSALAAVPDPPPDAGVVLPDSGNPRRDAGLPDAGPQDAGPPDAGPPGPTPSARGEGCQQAPMDGLGLWVLLLGLLPRIFRRTHVRSSTSAGKEVSNEPNHPRAPSLRARPLAARRPHRLRSRICLRPRPAR